jgi:hypothetical protein
MDFEIYTLMDCFVEFYDKKVSSHRLLKIENVFYSEYDQNKDNRIVKCYSKRYDKIISYELKKGSIVDFNLKLSQLILYQDGTIKITPPKLNPLVYQNRFSKGLQFSIDYSKYAKWEGGYNWIQIESLNGAYQIKNLTYGLENVKSCIVGAKNKCLNFLKENLLKLVFKT